VIILLISLTFSTITIEFDYIVNYLKFIVI